MTLSTQQAGDTASETAMKVLLISMGTRGDVEPFLAVGEVLLELDRNCEAGCVSVSVMVSGSFFYSRKLLS